MAYKVQSCTVSGLLLALTAFASAQLGDELDFGQVGDISLAQGGFVGGLSSQGHLIQQQHYNFPASSFGIGGLGGLAGGLLAGNLGIPSTESITQLGQAIAEGGVPSGTHGEIATPTVQPPPQGEERRAGIVNRLLGAGFLNRR